jgi:hypothetical protein
MPQSVRTRGMAVGGAGKAAAVLRRMKWVLRERMA